MEFMTNIKPSELLKFNGKLFREYKSEHSLFELTGVAACLYRQGFISESTYFRYTNLAVAQIFEKKEK